MRIKREIISFGRSNLFDFLTKESERSRRWNATVGPNERRNPRLICTVTLTLFQPLPPHPQPHLDFLPAPNCPILPFRMSPNQCQLFAWSPKLHLRTLLHIPNHLESPPSLRPLCSHIDQRVRGATWSSWLVAGGRVPQIPQILCKECSTW